MSTSPKRKLTPRQKRVVELASELTRYGMDKDCALSAADMVTSKQALRSGKTLASFVAYCEQHPTERFWQALRNWAGYNFILACDAHNKLPSYIHDTFYFGGRDG